MRQQSELGTEARELVRECVSSVARSNVLEHLKVVLKNRAITNGPDGFIEDLHIILGLVRDLGLIFTAILVLRPAVDTVGKGLELLEVYCVCGHLSASHGLTGCHRLLDALNEGVDLGLRAREEFPPHHDGPAVHFVATEP